MSEKSGYGEDFYFSKCKPWRNHLLPPSGVERNGARQRRSFLPVNGDANQLSLPILAVSMLPALRGLSPHTHGQRDPDKHLASRVRVAQSRRMAEVSLSPGPSQTEQTNDKCRQGPGISGQQVSGRSLKLTVRRVWLLPSGSNLTSLSLP